MKNGKVPKEKNHLIKCDKFCAIFPPLLQLFFVVTGALAYFLNPASRITDWCMEIAPGRINFENWKSLPTPINVNYYFFNVTNHEAFLDGREKLRVEEVGPFVYKENLLINNVTFNDNETVTYSTVRVPEFQRDLSVGDLNEMFIIAPYIPFIGVGSLLANRSKVTNFSFMSAMSYIGSKPFMNISIQELAWGFDDPLIKIANTFASSWITVQKFGLLDSVYAEGTNWVTMRLKDNDISPAESGYLPQYSIDKYNGLSGLPQWGYNDDYYANRETPLQLKPIESCKIVSGATEGMLFPRFMDTRIISKVYRKQFCRTLPMDYKRSENYYPGIQTDRYGLIDGVFDSAEKSESQRCFCDPDVMLCPPSGFSDISPCYYHIPVTMSLPHFLDADPEELAKIDGLTPEKSKHGTYIIIQPQLGMAVDVAYRLQLNIWIKNITDIPILRPLANMNIPLFWAEAAPATWPIIIIFLLFLLLLFLPITEIVLISFGCLSAVTLTFLLVRRVQLTKKTKIASENEKCNELPLSVISCHELDTT